MDAGGRDNITVVAVPIDSVPIGPPDEATMDRRST
jgi:hypothetical protein